MSPHLSIYVRVTKQINITAVSYVCDHSRTFLYTTIQGLMYYKIIAIIIIDLNQQAKYI